ncbi:MAG TPA: sugar MFS transporter [Bryobacteraceae bacterium]|nr:sugar MFS transporter [Bryobacteraceae bacterium]
MWGFVTVLNDILVPHLKSVFQLNYTETMLIQFTFFSAYFLFAMPAAKIISYFGYRGSIVLGLVVMACGALLFLPAASLPSYALFLTALYVLASGMTILQVSANPYVAVLGAPERASSRLNLVQAMNSLGTTVGPYVGGLLILSQGSAAQDASAVKLPYLGICLVLLAVAFVISRFDLPSVAQIETRGADGEPTGDSVWRHRPLVLAAIGIFVYVGAEVSIGSFLVSYLSQPNIGDMPARVAAGFVSFYWGGAMIGRFAGSAILRKLRTGPVLGTAAMIACALVVTSILTSGRIAMWSIILVGLFNSIMFPSIFTLGIDGLGKLTGKGSGILVMAIVGGAIIPILEGATADRIGIHTAFVLPAVCYLYIVYYGFRGSQASGTHGLALRSH